jgi:hypothetical protein
MVSPPRACAVESLQLTKGDIIQKNPNKSKRMGGLKRCNRPTRTTTDCRKGGKASLKWAKSILYNTHSHTYIHT